MILTTALRLEERFVAGMLTCATQLFRGIQSISGSRGEIFMSRHFARQSPTFVLRSVCWLFLMLSPILGLAAQQPIRTDSQSKPDSPEPKHSDTTSSGPASTFIGYVTNKSFIFPDIAASPGPLTAGRKFKIFVNQSISPPYLIAAGCSAASGQIREVPEAYSEELEGYGSRYGTALARASSNSFFGTFLFASMFHQDPRFFPQSEPSLWGSVKYSARRLVVTRNDSGKDVFNTSGLLGTLASETLANAYLPVSEQTGAKTAQRFGTDLAWRFAGNMFKNYWPTIFHNMGLNRLKVIPDPGSS